MVTFIEWHARAPVSRSRRLSVALALAGVALAGNGGVAPVEPASPNAERINDSYFWVAIFTGAIFLLVQGSLLWFIVRYRRRRRARAEDGAQIHGNTNLELAWTVAPVLILVAIGAFVFYKLPGIQDVPARERGGRPGRRAGGGLPLLLAASRTRTARSRSTGCAPRSARRSGSTSPRPTST